MKNQDWRWIHRREIKAHHERIAKHHKEKFGLLHKTLENALK